MKMFWELYLLCGVLISGAIWIAKKSVPMVQDQIDRTELPEWLYHLFVVAVGPIAAVMYFLLRDV